MGILHDWDRQYLWHPFCPLRFWLKEDPLIIERGEGVHLFDTEGKRYIDGVSSLWCNVHGHNHPYINAAIREQLERIAHSTLLGLASPPSIELAKRLVELTPEGLKRVFYSDSGATAVEIALKMAFQYWRNLGQSQRTRFIALRQSYHGDTMGSVSVGGIPIFHEIFGPLTFEALFSPTPHPYRFDGSPNQCRDVCLAQMADLLDRYAGQIAAIVVEPLVQGAAGMIVHPEGFLRGVARLARERNVLLIADEVATGFGRTGSMFACQQESVSPDFLCLAKGLTGGYLPLAATLATEAVFDAFRREPWPQTTFYHGHTYTGNALGCAAALASLDLFDRERTLEHLPAKMDQIAKALESIAELDNVGDVRRRGLMVGIELVEDRVSKRSFDPAGRVGSRLCHRMRDRGLILRPLGDVLVLMPPLAMPAAILAEMLDIVRTALERDLPDLL
ncbi:MAG: adenosylmethionine--8-amino-7-oxononanoate transaminase [Sedimentisphaerales bacterium]|nr:adenosylmethionine--8-amino-7-oxononanoate transaminase [Sedimentisphaerales bacterium]